MQYLAPFNVLKGYVTVAPNGEGLAISASYDNFLSMIKVLLRAVEVDEAWYRSTYPDVAEAIDAGTYKSGKSHFVDHGYFEGRMPFELKIDEEWYLSTNTDVAEQVFRGDMASGLVHFCKFGYLEGRPPFDY